MRDNTLEAGITGLVIYCSDPRPEVSLWKRIKAELLRKKRATALGILGGPISLAHTEHLPIEYACLMRQINFALKKFPSINEIIIVGHDCGYYEQIPHGNEFTVDQKEKDLRKAAKLLRRHFSGLKVAAFFAENGGNKFKRIRR